MNISSSPPPMAVSTEQALELVSASLSKSQQKLEGEMALSLLEPVQQAAPPASPNPRIGQHVNVAV